MIRGVHVTVCCLSVALIMAAGSAGADCIIYNSTRTGTADLWMTTEDGYTVPLTDKPGGEGGGRVAPDGAHLAYTWDGGGQPGAAGLWLMALDGSTDRLVIPDANGAALPSVGNFTFSPDGTRIAYAWITGAWRSEVRVIDIDGTDDHRLMGPPAGFTYVAPDDWKGDTLVLEAGYSHSGNNRLFTIDQDGGHLTQITFSHGDLARFNADGSRIAYFNVNNVTLIDPDGTDPLVLVAGVHRTGFAPFSPDGTRVGFAGFSHDSQHNDVYTVAVDPPHGMVAVTASADISSVTDFVACAGDPPVAALSWTPALPVAGEPVGFVDTSAGAPTGWQWAFGDGGASNLQHPTHTYVAAGAYEVTLAVWNAFGISSTSREITIEEPCSFGPEQQPIVLERRAGSPDSTSVAWESCGGVGTLVVALEHASSAWITLNGATVLAPGDVDPHVTALTFEVELIAGDNLVEAALRGKPGSRMTLTFLPYE